MPVEYKALQRAVQETLPQNGFPVLDFYRVSTASDTEVFLMECQLARGETAKFCHQAKAGETSRLAAMRLLKAFQLEQARRDVECLYKMMDTLKIEVDEATIDAVDDIERRYEFEPHKLRIKEQGQ